MAIELTSEDRDAVRTELLSALSEVGDFTTYIDHGEIAKARRVSAKFREYVALLDDLGWNAEDDRESFEVTLPPQEMVGVLSKLRLEIAGSLTDDVMEQSDRREIARTALASAVLYRMTHEAKRRPTRTSRTRRRAHDGLCPGRRVGSGGDVQAARCDSRGGRVDAQ